MTNIYQGPDFLVIGAMKSGTTTLAYDLEQHDQISFPAGKEVQLLASNSFKDEEELVRTYFRTLGNSPGSLIGDASPRYMMNDTKIVASRAKRLLKKNLKLICILRNPIDRTISHYKHMWKWTRGQFSSIDEALTDPLFSDTSLYGQQIQPWVDLFGKDGILVFRFEDYISNRQAHISRMFGFLGVEDKSNSIRTERALNIASDQYDKSSTLQGFRDLLRKAGLQKPLPPWLKNIVLPIVAKKAPEITEIPNEETLIHLKGIYANDILHLQELFGNPTLTWNLDDSIIRMLENS